ncbi:MAG: hypothetical protein NPIRA02_42240 [Nitrospirales bacterium]|nr:MAG: hypothetical protein NPIRA02_42240 [Nitrospirales bacterium]
MTTKAKELFGSAHRSGHEVETTQAKLYEEVGRLKMELAWVKNCRARLKRNVTGLSWGIRTSVLDVSVHYWGWTEGVGTISLRPCQRTRWSQWP